MNARAATSRLLALSAAFAFLSIVVALVVFSVSRSIERDGFFIHSDAVPGAEEANAIRDAASNGFRDTMLTLSAETPDEMRLRLSGIESEDAKIDAELKAYEDTILIDPNLDRANLVRFGQARDAYRAQRAGFLALVKAGREGDALRFNESNLYPAYTALVEATNTVVSYNEANTKRLAGGIARNAVLLRNSVLTAVGVGLLCLALLMLNLVARNREARELDLQAERFATAAKVSRMAMWVRNFNRDTVEWSELIDELAGCEPGGFPRTIAGWVAKIHAEDQPRVREAIRVFREHGMPFEVEYRILSAKGETVWLRDVGGKSIKNPQEGVMFGALRDVTERHRAADSTAVLEAQLRHSQKLEAIGTMAGGIAHDFNNLLTGIIGGAELMLMEMRERNHASLYSAQMETVLRAGRRAGDLVRQILTFSRRGEKRMEPMDIRPVTAEVAKLMRSTMPANIELVAVIPANAPLIVGDPTQIHQVLVNLCTNAAYAMRGTNGRLEIRVDTLKADLEFLKLHAGLRPGTHLRLSISDTGHGMDAVTMKRIFEPFFTTKPQGEGTGLGLSVVHGIIKEHGGGIFCYSHPGQGTVFHIYRPVLVRQFKEEAAEEDQIVPRGRRERILLVDDEPDMRSTTASLLGRLDYLVTPVANCDSALKLLRCSPDSFDLVITDLAMPDTTGLEFARDVLKLCPRMPIVLVTGFAGNMTRESVHEIGISELVMKPLTTEVLGISVRRVLDRSVADAVRVEADRSPASDHAGKARFT